MIALLLACSGPSDTGNPVLEAEFPGWTRTRLDTTTYAHWNAVREDWEIGSDWPGWFPTLLGDDRRFQIVRPNDAVEGARVPVLFALHGAAIDDDSDPDYYAGDPTETISVVTPSRGTAMMIRMMYVAPRRPPTSCQSGTPVTARRLPLPNRSVAASVPSEPTRNETSAAS